MRRVHGGRLIWAWDQLSRTLRTFMILGRELGSGVRSHLMKSLHFSESTFFSGNWYLALMIDSFYSS